MYKQVLEIIQDFYYNQKDWKIEGFSDYDDKEFVFFFVFEILFWAYKGEVEIFFVVEG